MHPERRFPVSGRRLGTGLLLVLLAAGPACDQTGVIGLPPAGDTTGKARDLGKPGDGPVKPGDGPAVSPCSPACPTGYTCDPTTKKCVIKGQCGAQKVQADLVPPNLLVVLDRSCSMTSKVSGTGLKKWDIAVAALTKLTTTYKGKIRFGLSLFPDITGGSCTQDSIAIPVGSGNEAAIQALLAAAQNTKDKNYPDGPCVTNIDTAMQQASQAAFVSDTTRENFVLLITDGAQAGCSSAGGDKGTTQFITDLYQKKKVATFVVGFGSAVDKNQLNIFAKAGGKPLSDPTTQYYKAEDQTTLDKALASIATTAFGCVLKLTKVPGNMDAVYVFFDGKPVKQDTTHKDGWDFDAQSALLTFYGAACQAIKDQKVKAVDIIFSCKNPTTDGGPLIPDGGGCPAGKPPCTAPKDCPAEMTCVSGCCSKVIQ